MTKTLSYHETLRKISNQDKIKGGMLEKLHKNNEIDDRDKIYQLIYLSNIESVCINTNKAKMTNIILQTQIVKKRSNIGIRIINRVKITLLVMVQVEVKVLVLGADT